MLPLVKIWNKSVICICMRTYLRIFMSYNLASKLDICHYFYHDNSTFDIKNFFRITYHNNIHGAINADIILLHSTILI